jgi:hypothetical protein
MDQDQEGEFRSSAAPMDEELGESAEEEEEEEEEEEVVIVPGKRRRGTSSIKPYLLLSSDSCSSLSDGGRARKRRRAHPMRDYSSPAPAQPALASGDESHGGTSLASTSASATRGTGLRRRRESSLPPLPEPVVPPVGRETDLQGDAPRRRRTSAEKVRKRVLSRQQESPLRLSAPAASIRVSPLWEDFTCPICWELLSGPVTLLCGHTACESCVAQYFKAQQDQGNAQITCPCPAGCQRRLPVVLPGVNTCIAGLLQQHFGADAVQERKQATEEHSELVSEMRNRNRQPRSQRWHRIGALEIEVPVNELPAPALRFYKMVGYLIAVMLLFTSTMFFPGSLGEPGGAWKIVPFRFGKQAPPSRPLFTLDLTAHEFVELHPFHGARSLFPLSSPTSSILYVSIFDPQLMMEKSSSSKMAPPAADGVQDLGLEVLSGAPKRRSLFHEFYGWALWSGMPDWAQRVLVVAASQAFPLLALMPYLRLGIAGGSSPARSVAHMTSKLNSVDLIVYAVIQLTCQTIVAWARIRSIFKQQRGILRALLHITVWWVTTVVEDGAICSFFYIIQNFLFGYLLSPSTRVLVSVTYFTFALGMMRLLALTLWVNAFLLRWRAQLAERLDALWCHAMCIWLGTGLFAALYPREAQAHVHHAMEREHELNMQHEFGIGFMQD